ncbi:hypothetical protein M1O20_03125 [Dehalococcoidia bacterium]|nr:hypothetical protein [Thermodesulfovibrionales bacterium]MCL0034896.1 hypothetical protein [Dehalococcoidia bacterium]MCL0059469.1 hypothetical protein [Dehalococcoidia bacterium]
MPTKVKFVQYGEQAKVKIVSYGEDMQVTPVDYGEEMKVKSVDWGEDFKVKIVKEGCVITSACIEAKGLPDDCSELNIVRAFRDSYIKSLPKGNELLHEYYEVAPQIVSGINRAANPKEIYSNLYEQLLSTIEMIEQGKEDEVLKHYFRILNELKQRYLH